MKERWLEQPDEVQAGCPETERLSKVSIRRWPLVKTGRCNPCLSHVPSEGGRPQSPFPALRSASALNRLPRTHNYLLGVQTLSLAARSSSSASEIRMERAVGSASSLSRKPGLVCFHKGAPQM